MKPVGARNAPCTVALRSIHPQGWVPIETKFASYISRATTSVAFTPKGGCPLKLPQVSPSDRGYIPVAFTPKGGCPLKLFYGTLHFGVYYIQWHLPPRVGAH